MLFETLTAATGWWLGLLLVLLAPLLLAAMALLAPVPLENGRMPAGFNPEQWHSLGYLATSQQQPWSVALMAANRARWLIGGSLAGLVTMVFLYVGYAGRLELTEQLRRTDQASAERATRIAALEGQLAGVNRDLVAERGRVEELRQRASRCETNAGQQIGAHSQQMTALQGQLAQEQGRREVLTRELIEARSEARENIDRYNRHLRDLNRAFAEQCPAATPPGRPQGLPEDRDLPTPPTNQRPAPPPPRPPFR